MSEKQVPNLEIVFSSGISEVLDHILPSCMPSDRDPENFIREWSNYLSRSAKKLGQRIVAAYSTEEREAFDVANDFSIKLFELMDYAQVPVLKAEEIVAIDNLADVLAGFNDTKTKEAIRKGHEYLTLLDHGFYDSVDRVVATYAAMKFLTKDLSRKQNAQEHGIFISFQQNHGNLSSNIEESIYILNSQLASTPYSKNTIFRLNVLGRLKNNLDFAKLHAIDILTGYCWETNPHEQLKELRKQS